MLNKLFENQYVQELSILKHCQLLLLFDNQYESYKALGDINLANGIRIQFEKELVDLMLILQEWKAGTIDKENLIKSRIAKFAEKGNQDVT